MSYTIPPRTFFVGDEYYHRRPGCPRRASPVKRTIAAAKVPRMAREELLCHACCAEDYRRINTKGVLKGRALALRGAS